LLDWQFARDVFTTLNSRTPDGERFHQRLAGRFLYFAPISYVSRQKSSNIHAIYYHTAKDRRQGAYCMWFIAMKGFAGSGKSTLSRALSKQLGWPVIDKDDVKDLLDGPAQAAGPLAYEIMFNIARRQLLQGLNVICDSPLTGINACV
jgi:hypothetical protein